jgi:hypothetical protein
MIEGDVGAAPQPDGDDPEGGLARQVRVILMPGCWVHPAARRSD